MPPVWKLMGVLKPLEIWAPMGLIMEPEEGKGAMAEACTGAGRGVLAKERLFRDVMLLRRLLVRSLAYNIKPGKIYHKSTWTSIRWMFGCHLGVGGSRLFCRLWCQWLLVPQFGCLLLLLRQTLFLLQSQWHLQTRRRWYIRSWTMVKWGTVPCPYPIRLRGWCCWPILFPVNCSSAKDIINLKTRKDWTELLQHRDRNRQLMCVQQTASSLTWFPVLGWLLGSSDGVPGFEMLMLLLEETIALA